MDKKFPYFLRYRQFINGVFLLAMVLLFSCEREENYAHPLVHTGEVTEITGDGAVFYGDITRLDDQEILDHGFVWNTQSSPTVNNSFKRSIGPTEGGSFNAKVHAGFEEGTEYFMRAYAITNQAVVYGRQVSFISKGGLPPEILDFSPKEAWIGDTVIVSGRHFPVRPGDQHFVRFNLHNAKIVQTSDETIKAIIPEELDSLKARIHLNIFNSALSFDDYLSILPPRIDNFLPEKGGNHTTVSIYGDGFHSNNKFNKIFIDSVELEVISSNRNRIQFKPVLDVPHGKHLIRVETLGQSTISQGYFEKTEPWKRLETPPFEPVHLKSFSFTIGDRVFAGNAKTFEFYEYIPAVNVWTRRKDVPFNYEIASYVFSSSTDGIGYLLIRLLSGTVRLYMYSPEDDNWTRLSNYEGVHKYGVHGFTVGNDLYFGVGSYPGGTTPGPAEFWKFEYAENTWIRLADFPFLESWGLKGFTYQDTGYFLGRFPTIEKYGIVRYNHHDDTWEFLLEINEFYALWTPHLAILTLNESIVFMVQESGNHRNHELYGFSPGSNQLDFIGSVALRHGRDFFTMQRGNVGYIGILYNIYDSFDFWQYDHDIPMK